MQCYPHCERVEENLQTRKCGSAYSNCSICLPHCYGAGGTVLNPYGIGPSGEDDINPGHVLPLSKARITSARILATTAPHAAHSDELHLHFFAAPTLNNCMDFSPISMAGGSLRMRKFCIMPVSSWGRIWQ